MKNADKLKIVTTIIGILLFIYGLSFIFVFNQGTFVILFLAVVLLLWTRVKSVPATRFFKFLLVLGYIFFGAIMVFIAVAGTCDKASGDEDAVIVLGCKVNESGVSNSLKARLDTTLEYHSINPKAKIIVTGGQGSNEPMTEAEAMKRYLVANGVPENIIYKEDKSTSTNENFANSKKILENLFDDDYTAFIITNSFHAYRSRGLAKLNGMNLTTYNAPTPYISMPVDYCREVLAVIKLWLFKY